MSANLRKLRTAAKLTQAKLASAIGVTQPTYQRWEAGLTSVPDRYLPTLARTLGTDEFTITGRRKPITISLYDESADENLSYYGEVAIHFSSGSDPLLLSISEGCFSRFHQSLQSDSEYITLESLANQTIIVRVKAISDVYFSSEAYDTYGPEHDNYKGTRFMNADTKDWQIIEHLAHDDLDSSDFEPQDIHRVREMIMITNEQYDKLVAERHIKAEDIDNERTQNEIETREIFSLATNVVYQLSNKTLRSITTIESKAIFEAFYPLVDYSASYKDGTMLRFEIEGRHRIAFINSRAVDYISIPTHQFEKGREEADEEE